MNIVNLGSVKSIVFIGGGEVLWHAIRMARERGLLVGAILAKRHAAELLSSRYMLSAALQNADIPVRIVQEAIEVSPQILDCHLIQSLALCFGPAWIFPSEVLQRFEYGMLNFNGIPLPSYIGGGHYTWQILNKNNKGGCHIQKITDQVDQGDLLMSHTFDLTNTARTLVDYFHQNELEQLRFLDTFFEKVVCGDDFECRKFSDLDNERLYFPRLYTAENGWIDWSWTGSQIESFCGAFGSPYLGASTRLNGRRIFFKKVKLLPEPSGTTFHPFCFGLIVRSYGGSIFVAVGQGLLQIEEYEFEQMNNMSIRIREGDRFFTDAATLQQARLYRPKIDRDGELTRPN
jgi:methionyl-tRNA formyltransferase